jgi:hypothetical protein
MFANTQMSGTNFAIPDICLTPVGPVITPVPYPNIALEMMGVPAAYTILYGGTPAHNLLTTVPISNGDNSGVLLGAVSHLVMGPTKFTTGAFTCLTFGAPTTRMTSVTMQNLINVPGLTLAPSQVKVLVLAP